MTLSHESGAQHDMPKSHLRRGSIAFLLLFSLLAGCGIHPPAPVRAAPGNLRDRLAAQIDQSRARARQYLLAHQSPDGAWRSDVYGFFKDGPSLSPHVLLALLDDRNNWPRSKQIVSGVDYLEALVSADGKLPQDLELIYPVYTAAEAIQCLVTLSPAPARRKTLDGWLHLLLGHQLIEPRGWQPTDLEYGGWGYAQQPPIRKPAGAFRGPWDWSNLSATLDALGALRAAGDASEFKRVSSPALLFVQRCQNYRDPEMTGDGSPLDGGFFFTPSAAFRNKAGSETDPQGRERFHSYGSMTCDGIQALLACGLPRDHPRVIAARRWLEANFTVAHNPGKFIAANEDLRDATYYYYARSLARALARLGDREIRTGDGKIDWAAALATELMKRQRPDGSWSNTYTDGKEDDPLVATPLALTALSVCRDAVILSSP